MAFDIREYRKVYMPAYKAAHPEYFREFDKRRYGRAKDQAWKLLGSSCLECGESEVEFLTIDHVNGDGAEERARKSRRQIFHDIAKGRVDLSRYQVLCRNCNSGKANLKAKAALSESIHPFSGPLCRVCGNPKLVRTSSHPFYGSRKRSECRHCLRSAAAGTRLQALLLFGGKCSCCFQRDPSKLTFDHIRNDGATERRKDHCGTVLFYRKLLKGDLDSGLYQLLCWNCNFSKHLGNGLCVHQRNHGV